jgi:hypothetical protein
MVAYKFSLNLRDSPDPYSFFMDLSHAQENNPESIFTSAVRQAIQQKFQEDSSCKIRDNHLNLIVNTWIQDIQEGYRESSLTLDLPLLIDSNIELIKETGNQDLPSLVPIDLVDIEPTNGLLPPLDIIF